MKTITNLPSTKNVSTLLVCIMLSLSNLFANNLEEGDNRIKIRLEFNSADTYNRKITVIADENATSGFDSDYDTQMESFQADDMYWVIANGKLENQAINEVDKETVLALGVEVNSNGMNTIAVDKLENFPSDLEIYIHDKNSGSYHNIKDGAYQVYLNAGLYLNRFDIVFEQPETLGVNGAQLTDVSMQILYSIGSDQIKISNHTNMKIEAVEIYSILGQAIHKAYQLGADNEVKINADMMSTGAYIVIVQTSTGSISKKVIVS